MYQDMHVTKKWEFTEPMAVWSIYKLFTEKDYIINHRIIIPDKYFFIYTMEGVGHFVVDDEPLVVGSNSLVVVNAKRNLYYRCSGPKWNFWLIEFKTTHLRLIPNHVYPLTLSKAGAKLCTDALEEFKQERLQTAAALFQALYYTSCRMVQQADRGQTHRLLNSALLYMRENIGRFSVKELCRYLNVEEWTLRNIFMRELSTSPKRYFEYLRLEESKRYLETTSLSIAAIATQLGFSNPGHFSTAFRKEYGQAPMKYRQDFNVDADSTK